MLNLTNVTVELCGFIIFQRFNKSFIFRLKTILNYCLKENDYVKTWRSSQLPSKRVSVPKVMGDFVTDAEESGKG